MRLRFVSSSLLLVHMALRWSRRPNRNSQIVTAIEPFANPIADLIKPAVCGPLFNNRHSSANRIPERFSPGTFDYFFASHQIFHLFVVAAALAHYASVLTAFGHWHSRLGECPAPHTP